MNVNSIENQEGCRVEEDDTTAKRVESESTIPVSQDNINSQGTSDIKDKGSESQLLPLKEGSNLLTKIKTEDGGSEMICTVVNCGTEEEGIMNESEKETSPEKERDSFNAKTFEDFSFSSNNEKEPLTAKNAVSTEVTEVIVVDAKNGEVNGVSSASADITQSDSAYREKQDESCDSSSDSEDSVIFVQAEEKCIIIESDDQEENK